MTKIKLTKRTITDICGVYDANATRRQGPGLPEVACELDAGHEGLHRCGSHRWDGETPEMRVHGRRIDR